MPARQIKGRTRRALSNDEIEEDRLPEKRRQRGDVEDAERASSSLNVNRRNANDKSARKVDDSDESDLQDDQDDAIDVENFKGQYAAQRRVHKLRPNRPTNRYQGSHQIYGDSD